MDKERKNMVNWNLSDSEALSRRWKFRRAASEGKLSKASKREFVLRVWGSDSKRALEAPEDAVQLKLDAFSANIEELKRLGCHDERFLGALELGRALSGSELDAHDLFAIWCGMEDRMINLG
jgi:hypothetical protein